MTTTNTPSTVAEVIAVIDGYAKMDPPPTPEEWRAIWPALLFNAKLGAVGNATVIDHLSKLGIGGKQALKSDLKTFYAEQEVKIRKAATKNRREESGKTVISLGLREEAVITKIEEVLVKANDPELPLMRDMNGYVRPVVDRPDWCKARHGEAIPTIAMLAPHDEASLRWGIDRHIELERDVEIVKPDEHAMRLLQNPLPKAPMVRGLITHPLVRADGRLIDKPGLDVESELYLHLGGKLGTAPPFIEPAIPIPDDPDEAQRLAARYVKDLLRFYDDYKFESEVDKAVALSSRMGILTRKDLDIAPCYLLVGPERGTGKTTMAAIDHVIATGHDIPAAKLEDDSEKAKQTLFAAFSSSPAAVLFDNLEASECYGNDVLAQGLTKGVMEARRFHSQVNVRATTNVQLYFTGNAVTLNEDLQARTLEVRFAAERPTRWSHPDWLAYARSIREEVRVKLQFIQRAYVRHGAGKVAGVYTRFPGWALRVRDPLLWAELKDVGERLQELEDQNPNRAVDAGIVGELHNRFDAKKFTAGAVVTQMGSGNILDRGDPAFKELRSMIQERWPRALGKSGAQFLGQYFREHLRRWFRLEDGRSLRLKDSTEKGLTRWVVETQS